jgi:L-alanine-DL-glutamate epimerase-like enolase superfamily enzyme
MKITNVTTETFRWPRKVTISNGKHTYTHSGVRLVKIETDEGTTGVGVCAVQPIIEATIEHLIPLLIGEDPIDVERLWHKMWVPKLIGRRDMTTRAIGGIDIALWDLRAKVAGMPLYKMLGGFRNRMPTYVTGGYYVKGEGIKELQREMQDSVEMGARAVKMKIGAVPINEDVARVKAVREAIGPDVKLLIDANCAYHAYEAIQLARKVEDYDIFWFEEPVAPDDYEGHKRLAASSIIPIATGENEYTRYGFRDLIATGAVPILNADAKVLGGITEWLKVAALAQAHDLHVAPHGSQDIHVSLVSSISNGLLLEFHRDSTNPLWQKAYKNPLTLNDDGTVSPPEVPGAGIDPNYEVLEQYRVA